MIIRKKALSATLLGFCLAQTSWTQIASAQPETAAPTATEAPTATPQNAPIENAPIEDKTEAESQFEAVVDFEGDVNFTMTTANRDARQVLFEQSKYRRDGSLQNEINYFYSLDGALLQKMQIDFDAKSRFIEYSLFDAQGKGRTTIRLAPKVKPNTTQKVNPQLTLVAKPPAKIEGFNPRGDGTKIVWKLRADGTLESKSLTRAMTEILGAINFVSQYDSRGLRSEMSAFLRDGSRRSHVVFARDAVGKLMAVQYAGAGNGTRYSYDKNGRLSETRFLQDGKVARRFVFRSTKTGKIGEMLTYDVEGLLSRETLTHDAKDRLASTSLFDGKNALQQKTTFKYDAQSRQIERETRDAKGQILRRTVSEYRNGKLQKITTKYADGSTQIENFDAQGNLVKSAN